PLLFATAPRGRRDVDGVGEEAPVASPRRSWSALTWSLEAPTPSWSGAACSAASVTGCSFKESASVAIDEPRAGVGMLPPSKSALSYGVSSKFSNLNPGQSGGRHAFQAPGTVVAGSEPPRGAARGGRVRLALRQSRINFVGM